MTLKMNTVLLIKIFIKNWRCIFLPWPVQNQFESQNSELYFQSLSMSREMEDNVISVDRTDFERVAVENSLTP